MSRGVLSCQRELPAKESIHWQVEVRSAFTERLVLRGYGLDTNRVCYKAHSISERAYIYQPVTKQSTNQLRTNYWYCVGILRCLRFRENISALDCLSDAGSHILKIRNDSSHNGQKSPILTNKGFLICSGSCKLNLACLFCLQCFLSTSILQGSSLRSLLP